MFADLHHQPLITDLPALSTAGLPAALRRFCQRPAAHREAYLQARYGKAFDGYSYPGQTDSLNQGEEDQLHSFVFSDFYAAARYPKELQPFIINHWPELTLAARKIEQHILIELGLEQIALQHTHHCGHMMSANYYPSQPEADADEAVTQPSSPLRLSSHPDVSLLTVFPGGLGKDFQYRNASGAWVDAPVTNKVVVFAGDLLQWLTNNKVPALEHRVKHSASNGERFSFALFSLPMPGATLVSNNGQRITTEEWYRLHLSQWDD